MATYWVEAGHGGTDSGTETNPYLTIAQAVSVVAAGDHVWVRGGTAYAEALAPTTTGAFNNSITFEGWTTTTGDGGQFTLEGGGSLANGVSTSTAYYLWANMIVNNYTGTGFLATSSDYLGFRNCEFTNNGNVGAVADNDVVFENCKFNNNSVYGLEFGYRAVIIGCEFDGNTQWGAYSSDSGSSIHSSIFSGNTSGAVWLTDGFVITNCTIDGGGGASTYGIRFGSSSTIKAAINNIVYDCDKGIYSDTALRHDQISLGLNNLLNSNTTDYTNWPTREQASDITDAPGFTDEAGGGYTLASTSAARNAGADVSGSSSPGMDIGAHQSEDAGGGSRVIITG